MMMGLRNGGVADLSLGFREGVLGVAAALPVSCIQLLCQGLGLGGGGGGKKPVTGDGVVHPACGVDPGGQCERDGLGVQVAGVHARPGHEFPEAGTLGPVQDFQAALDEVAVVIDQWRHVGDGS